MSTVRSVGVIRILAFFYVFSSVAYAGSLPVIAIESRLPLRLSVFDGVASFDLPVPKDFIGEVEGVYDEVYLQGLTGDGVAEVIFHLNGEGVNYCSRALYYNSDGQFLRELVFGKGGLCDFKVRNGYIVSSYKDGAAWVEDVYAAKGEKVSIKISDRCVGCSEVSRQDYRSDGLIIKYLVSNNVDFEKRTALVASVASLKARIFSSPEATRPTKKYLVRGNRISLLSFENVSGEDWVEFRFLGKSIIEGWLKCTDLDGCRRF